MDVPTRLQQLDSLLEKEISVGSCKLHDRKQILFYCKACDDFICAVCRAGAHKDHLCKCLDSAVEPLVEEIKKSVPKLLAKHEQLNAVEQVLSTHYDEVFVKMETAESELSKRFVHLQGKLEKWYKDSLNNVMRIFDDASDKCQEKLCKAESSQKRLNHLVEKLVNLTTDQTDMFQSAEYILDSITEVDNNIRHLDDALKYPSYISGTSDDVLSESFGSITQIVKHVSISDVIEERLTNGHSLALDNSQSNLSKTRLTNKSRQSLRYPEKYTSEADMGKSLENSTTFCPINESMQSIGTEQSLGKNHSTLSYLKMSDFEKGHSATSSLSHCQQHKTKSCCSSRFSMATDFMDDSIIEEENSCFVTELLEDDDKFFVTEICQDKVYGQSNMDVHGKESKIANNARKESVTFQEIEQVTSSVSQQPQSGMVLNFSDIKNEEVGEQIHNFDDNHRSRASGRISPTSRCLRSIEKTLADIPLLTQSKIRAAPSVMLWYKCSVLVGTVSTDCNVVSLTEDAIKLWLDDPEEPAVHLAELKMCDISRLLYSLRVGHVSLLFLTLTAEGRSKVLTSRHRGKGSAMEETRSVHYDLDPKVSDIRRRFLVIKIHHPIQSELRMMTSLFQCIALTTSRPRIIELTDERARLLWNKIVSPRDRYSIPWKY